MPLGDKDVFLKFFTQTDNPEQHKCKICAKVLKRAVGTSFRNIAIHVRAAHRDAIAEAEAAQTAGQRQLQLDSFSPETVDIYRWIDWLVTDHFAFSFVDSPKTRMYSKIGTTISRQRLSQLVHKLYDVVLAKVRAEIPEKFGIMFDGMSTNGFHYCGTFAVYDDDGQRKELFLHFGTFRFEDSFKADDYIDHFTDVLETVGRSRQNVTFLVSDNCATNQSIGTKMDIPLIGCAAHRLNLAVNDIYETEEYAPLIAKVQELMKVCRTLKCAGKLRANGAGIRAYQRNNFTRWGAVHNMLVRYVKLIPFLHMDEPLWMNYLLIPTEITKVHQLITILKKFEEVNLQLQRDSIDINIHAVRLMFDLLIAHYPPSVACLGVDANIIHRKHFERGVEKVIAGRENDLTFLEINSLHQFKKNAEIEDEPLEASQSMRAIVDSAKVKRIRVDADSAYYDLSYITPTSVTVERLFSRVNFLLGLRRHSMDEETVNALLFLEFNRQLWNVQDVSVVLQGVSDDVEAEM